MVYYFNKAPKVRLNDSKELWAVHHRWHQKPQSRHESFMKKSLNLILTLSCEIFIKQWFGCMSQLQPGNSLSNHQWNFCVPLYWLHWASIGWSHMQTAAAPFFAPWILHLSFKYCYGDSFLVPGEQSVLKGRDLLNWKAYKWMNWSFCRNWE